MASGLKARLRQITESTAQPRKPSPKLHELTYLEHAHIADRRLYELQNPALSRIGLTGSWPGIERALFLDTETTGLSRGAGTIVFMIGLGYVKDGVFIVEQHMVGDYPDEPLMMHRFAEIIKRFDVIVTFNGNAFDLPLLEGRAVMCRMPPLFQNHSKLDLMHPSRRLWKRRLGSCRLSVLEEQILSSGREDDLPGSEAPARFFRYLETGDIHLLDEVLKHNRLDILSLGALLIKLCEAYAAPDQQIELPDLYSMGRAMERMGERELAEQCYLRASKPRPVTGIRQLREQRYSDEACLSLSMIKKRAGDYEYAERLFQSMAQRGQMGARPWIELSKLYEHKTKQPHKALNCAYKALAAEQEEQAMDQILHRIHRLERKCAACADDQEE